MLLRGRSLSAEGKVNLAMLWTSLRWNWANTLAVAGFCLLAILGAVNNTFVFYDHDGADRGEALARAGLYDKDQQPAVSAPRADVAPVTTALLQSRPVAFD